MHPHDGGVKLCREPTGPSTQRQVHYRVVMGGYPGKSLFLEINAAAIIVPTIQPRRRPVLASRGIRSTSILAFP